MVSIDRISDYLTHIYIADTVSVDIMSVNPKILKQREERYSQIISYINEWVYHFRDESEYGPLELYDHIFPKGNTQISRSKFWITLKFIDNLRFLTWTRPQTPPKEFKGRPPIPEEERDKPDRPMRERLLEQCKFIMVVEYGYPEFSWAESMAEVNTIAEDEEPTRIISVKILGKD